MKFSTLMIIKALVCLVFGVTVLVNPEFLYGVLGATLTAGGAFAAREYGASMMGNMLVTWLGRKAHESEARRAVIIGLCIYDAVGFVITLIATLAGVLNPLGWLIVVVYLFFALGFGYFWLKSPQD